ncbi:MAG: S9 family peptidase [Flavobacteriaceae bacterium]|nr:S9 family peptidase [Flavobacteriaceae bacterium]
MKKYILLVVFAAIQWVHAQEETKEITIESIYNGSFRTKGMDVLHSMKDGLHYTVQNFDRQNKIMTIDKYQYKNLEKIATLVHSANLEGVNYFSSYHFSEDESKLILATDVEAIYRRSRLGKYFVYDLKSKKLTAIYDQKIQEPTFSPDGTKVGFVFNNNIYVKDLEDGTVKQITKDGEKNKIINGITDWVYEEEFSFVRAFQWSPDSKRIAYLRFDETDVPEFSMDLYGQELYQTQQRFKYPKAGEKNAIVTLHMHYLNTAKTVAVDLNNAYYIPRLKWTKNSSILSVQVLNRHQNHIKLYFVDTNNNTKKIVLEEKDAAYIETVDNLTFLNNNSFIWNSEKSGYNHLYLYDKTGKEIRQITKGEWEVTNYYGFNPKNARIYYQSTETGAINRGVYSIGINGKGKRALAQRTGQNNANFSANFSYFINSHSSSTTPPAYTLNKAKDGKQIKEIVNNNALLKKLENYQTASKEFSTLSINGNDLNMWMMKPKDFDPNKKYPLFMTQYSGPGSQSVANRWNGANDYWYQMLANKGYIVVCVDGRGTGFKGRDFKKSTYMNLVKYETEDQIAAAKKLSKLPYIDETRTGIWGWSFGGHMSTNCLLKGADTFEVAVAVAPVTSWRFYDTVYTERYMRTPQENPEGYDANSPFNYPEKLEGKYLLVHGSGDDNVHVQNSMRMAEALIQANKQFDWAIYPDKNHGIYGGNTRIHLYNKMTNFIDQNLGDKRNSDVKEVPATNKIKG